MEKATEASYLPVSIKEKVIEELKEKKFIMDDEKPIGKGTSSYVYRIRRTVKKELGVCKVVVIPGDLFIKSREDLSKSIQEEVLIVFIV